MHSCFGNCFLCFLRNVSASPRVACVLKTVCLRGAVVDALTLPLKLEGGFIRHKQTVQSLTPWLSVCACFLLLVVIVVAISLSSALQPEHQNMADAFHVFCTCRLLAGENYSTCLPPPRSSLRRPLSCGGPFGTHTSAVALRSCCFGRRFPSLNPNPSASPPFFVLRTPL